MLTEDEVKRIATEVANNIIATNDQAAKQQDDRVVFQELCDTARHYSNLRFVMFTVFNTILAALLGLELRRYLSPNPAAELSPELILAFRIASLMLALLFFLLQVRVSQLIVFYQEESAKFSQATLRLSLATSHRLWKYVAPVSMTLPFFLAASFWIWRLWTNESAAFIIHDPLCQ